MKNYTPSGYLYAHTCDTYHSHRATYVRLCPVKPINLVQEITQVYTHAEPSWPLKLIHAQ